MAGLDTTTTPIWVTAAVGVGAAIISRLPDIWKMRGEGSRQRRADIATAATDAGTLAMGMVQTLMSRVTALELQAVEREREHVKQMSDMRDAYEARISKVQHEVNNLKMQMSGIMIVAEMPKGEERDRMVDRFLAAALARRPTLMAGTE